MNKKYLKQNLTLTTLTNFLNENEKFKKDSKKVFTTNNIFQYIRLGHLPYYMGGNAIERVEGIESIKLYNLLDNE